MSITDEMELMIEVEDILDELHTLKMVLKDQERVIVDLNKILEEFAAGGRKPPEVETRTVENHLLRIERMEEAAKKADTSVSGNIPQLKLRACELIEGMRQLHRLMDLKQKQASLTEAWYARESARDTARQGKTVIVFTVVTILFVSRSIYLHIQMAFEVLMDQSYLCLLLPRFSPSTRMAIPWIGTRRSPSTT